MTAGRPPSTVEGRARKIVRDLRAANGDMRAFERLEVMQALLNQARASARYAGTPDIAGLIRLAAHALVWAEEIERSEPE